jgi:hypothetical protein
MATTITHVSITQASGVTAPRISNNPQTNSTVETTTVLSSGKGTCASINVLRICFRCSGTKSWPRPERKNSKPTANLREKNSGPFPRMQFAEENPNAGHKVSLKSKLLPVYKTNCLGAQFFSRAKCFAKFRVRMMGRACEKTIGPQFNR